MVATGALASEFLCFRRWRRLLFGACLRSPVVRLTTMSDMVHNPLLAADRREDGTQAEWQRLAKKNEVLNETARYS
jgi:hypothetical protein